MHTCTKCMFLPLVSMLHVYWKNYYTIYRYWNLSLIMIVPLLDFFWRGLFWVNELATFSFGKFKVMIKYILIVHCKYMMILRIYLHLFVVFTFTFWNLCSVWQQTLIKQDSYCILQVPSLWDGFSTVFTTVWYFIGGLFKGMWQKYICKPFII